MLVYLFPGQGSQSKGMGRELFESALFPRPLEQQIDSIVGYSLKEMCLNGSEEQLRKTEVTQPCLYIVNALHYQKRSAAVRQPAYLAGHSLGEYNALLAAGAFDLLTGLKLVVRRGQLMAAAPNGAMAAILGIDAKKVAAALKLHGLTSLDLANFNTPAQVVISGPADDIKRAESAMTKAGATSCIPLQVSAPFHSRYMGPAASEFEAFLSTVDFKPLKLTVISNVTARPYPIEGGNAARALLVQQIKSQVLWSPSIGYLKAKGVKEFVEVGPGMTLTRMLPHIPALALRELEAEARDDAKGGSSPAQPLKLPTGEATRQVSVVRTPEPTMERQPAKPLPFVGRPAPQVPAAAPSFPQRGAPKPLSAGNSGAVQPSPSAHPRPALISERSVAPAAVVVAEDRAKSFGSSSDVTLTHVEAPAVVSGTPRTLATAPQMPMLRSLVDAPAAKPARFAISPEALGSAAFKADYGVRYAYIAGSMYKGIASKEMVIAMSRQRLLGYLGTGGMDLDEIEAAIRFIKDAVPRGAPYGVNLLHNEDPALEEKTVDLFLKHDIQNVEAAAYISLTPALVRYRLAGLRRADDGGCVRRHRVIAKVSRPEVAAVFMRPAPAQIVGRLLETGKITPAQAELARTTPMSDDICVESDSGGHTDSRVALTLFPAILLQRDEIAREYPKPPGIRVGAAGGIGTPHAAAAAFIMGADFILTGSINQCSVEAGTSDAVKDLLETIEAQDTAYAPAGDMFEYGAKVQVARKGLFFHTRANKLYELYMRHNSLEEIDEKTLRQIEDKFFKKKIADVWAETKAYYARTSRADVADIEERPKQKMALIFKWYFVHSNRLALSGSAEQRVDYQIQCGPALGAFNRWVKGTPLESWRRRHVDDIAERLMKGAAEHLNERVNTMSSIAL